MRFVHAAVWSTMAVLTACANVPVVFPPSAGTPGATPAPGDAAAIAAEVVTRTNEARARNGLSAFRTNARLMEAARLHAQQMAARQQAAHTISGAQYPTMQSRLSAVGYAYASAAENVAWNQRSPREVVDTWMNSSGHRANILDSELTEIGAAMARSAKGAPYWVQVFGKPR